MRRINEHYGIVTTIGKNNMVIMLPKGGSIDAPITEGIRIGNEVVFIMDALQKQVASVMLKSCAEHIIARAENHLLDASEREAPLEEGEESYENTTEIERTGFVFWCPDLGGI